MKISKDKISIVIPYFRKIDFIEQTLQSVFNQSYKNYELIIIYDDIDKFDLSKLKLILKKNKKKIKLIINSKNLGAGLSRNKGAMFAKGKYIAFLDSDDLWKKNKLKTQLKFMKKNNLKISHTSYYVINENNDIKGSRKAKYKLNYNDLIKSCDIGLSSVIIDKNLFLKNKFSSNETKEDYVAWLKISKKMPIYGLNKYLMLWRKTEGSLSSNTMQKLFDAYDVYKNKEKMSFFKALLSVMNLSINYLKKR